MIPVDLLARLDTYGPLLNAREMAPLWQITVSQFYKLAQQGAYDVFKATPTIGPRCYVKALVAKYLNGEPIGRSQTFGKKTRGTRRKAA